MAEIRHIALFTPDPKKLAEYYANVFGMKITGESNLGAVWITDGVIDFALLPQRNSRNLPKGINHFGFTLSPDEVGEVERKMAAYGLATTKPPADRPYVELKGKDIDGNTFDIATSAVVQADAGKVESKPAPVEAAAH